MTSRTMSVTIMPSPTTPPFPAFPMVPFSASPSPSKKPKLSLNTVNVGPSFGKESVSLRLETLSATSPTARNTFRNGYFMKQSLPKPQLSKRSFTPIMINTTSEDVSTSSAKAVEEVDINVSELPSYTASAPAVSSTDSTTVHVPYKLACNVTPILTNGPFAQTKDRKILVTRSNRALPPVRCVSFRDPLTEDITPAKVPTLGSPSSETSTDSTGVETKPLRQYADRALFSPPPRTGTKRHFIEDNDEDGEDDSDSYPVTPVAGKRKCDREWVWTLGPIPNSDQTQREAEIWTRGQHEAEGTA